VTSTVCGSVWPGASGRARSGHATADQHFRISGKRGVDGVARHVPAIHAVCRGRRHAANVVAGIQVLRLSSSPRDLQCRMMGRGARCRCRSGARYHWHPALQIARARDNPQIPGSQLLHSQRGRVPGRQRVLLEHGAQRRPRRACRKYGNADRPLAWPLRARPMPLATRFRKQVDVTGDLWTSVIESRGSPLRSTCDGTISACSADRRPPPPMRSFSTRRGASIAALGFITAVFCITTVPRPLAVVR